MKYSTIASALAFAVPAIANPMVVKRDAALDLKVLQFALTLEHLENAFYSHFLRRFGYNKDFKALGFAPSYFTNLKYIASDEKAHVQLLETVIAANGQKPVEECQYTFQDQDLTAKDFITLSSILEGVGTSAYLGGAPLITDKNYLTAAGSILVTEALHTSLQRNALNEVPFATPYGTPLDPNSVYTLAAAFIKSCPSQADSTKLGFTAYPTLTSKATGAVDQGSTVSFTTTGVSGGEFFLTFYSGLYAYSVQASSSGMTYSAAVPKSASLQMDIGGQVYVILTNKAAEGNAPSSITGANVIAGPAIIEVNPAAPCFLGTGCGVS